MSETYPDGEKVDVESTPDVDPTGDPNEELREPAGGNAPSNVTSPRDPDELAAEIERAGNDPEEVGLVQVDDEVKRNTDPDLVGVHSAPEHGLVTTPDGVDRIVVTDPNTGWKPAPVESDPALRERNAKIQAELEARADAQRALLER